MSNEFKMGRRNIGAMQTYNDVPKDDVRKNFDFTLAVAEINTGRVQSPEELADRFEKLFDIAAEQGMLPRYEHLALISGLPKSTFYDYGNEKYEHTPNPKYSEIIKKAKLVIASMEAGLATTGKIPAPVYIFREKNYSGMKDTQDIQVTPNQNSQIPENAEEIIDKLPERSSASDVAMLESGE